ncbi:DNA topoisomerase [Cunninghamella echinulata]|nr:DNA topoisomerase [Cunninghamella echinulata]
MKIMGLNFGTQYNDVNDIRYGRVLIITENNYQGALSKGLILSFFEKLFPSLLKIRDFIGDLTTPIKKCVNMDDGQEKLFFYNTDYEKWSKNVNESIWSIKEIKNLNSLNENDARLFFGNIKRYHRKIEPLTENDAELLDLVFSAHKIRERNEWIKNLNKEDHIDQRGPVNIITTFLKPILACYFIDNNLRAIPHLMDGCTTTQRRIVNECFKKDKEFHILELANSVCHSTKLYHEANQYIADMCKMVQPHNINIINSFGKVDTDYYTFNDNIKYNNLYIRVSFLLRSIFLQEDDDILPYCDNDNGALEKKYFLPILPMILINGSNSIGDGFVSIIPKFNPKDIAECIISMLDGNEPEELKPWFADFKGTIKKNETEEFYTTYGDAHFQDDTSIIISRLPYGQKATDIIDHLKKLIPNENQYGIYIEMNIQYAFKFL